jgi:hypothetical protein
VLALEPQIANGHYAIPVLVSELNPSEPTSSALFASSDPLDASGLLSVSDPASMSSTVPRPLTVTGSASRPGTAQSRLSATGGGKSRPGSRPCTAGSRRRDDHLLQSDSSPATTAIARASAGSGATRGKGDPANTMAMPRAESPGKTKPTQAAPPRETGSRPSHNYDHPLDRLICPFLSFSFSGIKGQITPQQLAEFYSTARSPSRARARAYAHLAQFISAGGGTATNPSATKRALVHSSSTPYLPDHLLADPDPRHPHGRPRSPTRVASRPGSTIHVRSPPRIDPARPLSAQPALSPPPATGSSPPRSLGRVNDPSRLMHKYASLAAKAKQQPPLPLPESTPAPSLHLSASANNSNTTTSSPSRPGSARPKTSRGRGARDGEGREGREAQSRALSPPNPKAQSSSSVSKHNKLLVGSPVPAIPLHLPVNFHHQNLLVEAAGSGSGSGEAGPAGESGRSADPASSDPAETLRSSADEEVDHALAWEGSVEDSSADGRLDRSLVEVGRWPPNASRGVEWRAGEAGVEWRESEAQLLVQLKHNSHVCGEQQKMLIYKKS